MADFEHPPGDGETFELPRDALAAESIARRYAENGGLTNPGAADEMDWLREYVAANTPAPPDPLRDALAELDRVLNPDAPAPDPAPDPLENARIKLCKACIEHATPPLEMHGFADYGKKDLPERLIWGASGEGAVLSVGDIAILSGAGGGGKSTLALQLACAMANGEKHMGQSVFPVCGLRVRCGRVLYASYEDVPAVQCIRAAKICGGEKNVPGPDLLQGVKMFGRPLYGPAPDGSANDVPGPLAAFRPLFDEAQRMGASLVIIDPAAAAFISPAASVEWVRLFMDALRIEAEKIGCGILLVAHSTKAARNGKGESDPGNVAGSAAWHDAARGVLVLHPPQRKKDLAPGLEVRENPRLECMKANYGPRFEDIYLQWDDFGKWTRTDPPNAFGPKNGNGNGNDPTAGTAF